MFGIENERFIFDKFRITDLFYADYCDRKSLYDFMKKNSHLVKGKVLDFGCGEKPYQKLCVYCNEYIGIDTIQSGHWEGKRRNAPDIFYDGKNIPFSNEEFDTVLSNQVFEHVQDICFSMKEISRVTKQGGIIIVTVPMAEEEHELPYDFRRFTQVGLEDFLNVNGYQVIESGKLNSWKNTLRILKIADICHNCKNSVIRKMYKYIYILIQNLIRMMRGNKMEQACVFSNKVYCIARKVK